MIQYISIPCLLLVGRMAYQTANWLIGSVARMVEIWVVNGTGLGQKLKVGQVEMVNMWGELHMLALMNLLICSWCRFL